jgi:hypothetical protein
MRINIKDTLNKSMNIIRGVNFPINEIKLLTNELPIFEPVPWQLRDVFQEVLEYEEVNKPMNPFTRNGKYDVYLAHLKPEYRAELELRFYLCELNSISLRIVRIKDNTIIFNNSIFSDELKELAYSDIDSLINDFNNKKDSELENKMSELKAYTLILLAFIHNFLHFPTHNCEVVTHGNLLKSTDRAIKHIQNVVTDMGETLQEILLKS